MWLPLWATSHNWTKKTLIVIAYVVHKKGENIRCAAQMKFFPIINWNYRVNFSSRPIFVHIWVVRLLCVFQYTYWCGQACEWIQFQDNFVGCLKPRASTKSVGYMAMVPCDTFSRCEAGLDYCFIGGPLFLKCPHFQAS